MAVHQLSRFFSMNKYLNLVQDDRPSNLMFAVRSNCIYYEAPLDGTSCHEFLVSSNLVWNSRRGKAAMASGLACE